MKKENRVKPACIGGSLILLLGAAIPDAFANTPKEPQEPPSAEIEQVTRKYWAQGEESELGVVQNRTYRKSKRITLDLLTGSLSTDPFLSVRTFGVALGWNLNEDWGIQAIAWKAVSTDSAAYESFRTQAPLASVDRNPPLAFYGVQANRSILYGKTSLLGHSLLYVDVFLFGGAGINITRNGSLFAPFVGIGQKIHLSQNLSLHLDYRILRFSETLSGPGGTNQRTNTTDSVSIGLGVLF
jgi:outer membrane beta-barrel protein